MEKVKIIKVKSWDELPEVLEPGIYNVAGVTFTIKEPIPREEVEYVYREYVAKGKTLV
jgi:hypothetical protein